MRTVFLFCALGALLPADAVLADEAEGSATSERHAAHGVWHAVYTNYVRSRIVPLASSGRASLPDSSRTSIRSEPIIYVLTLDVRGTDVTGAMTAGLAVRYEDPQEAMKRLLGVALEEPRPPPSRVVEGAVEGEQRVLLEVAGTARRLEHGAAMTAEVDGDDMRARVELPNGGLRLVRFERCTVGVVAGENASGEASSVDPAAYCTADAIWQRLAEAHGLPVDPNRSRTRTRTR